MGIVRMEGVVAYRFNVDVFCRGCSRDMNFEMHEMKENNFVTRKEIKELEDGDCFVFCDCCGRWIKSEE